MLVLAGWLVEKDGKLLMVQEAKKKWYGMWNFPSGHVEDNETIKEAAIREVFEETGCKVRLTGFLPITTIALGDIKAIVIRFVGEIIEENINFNKDEILDVKWFDKTKIKSMSDNEIRGYETCIDTLKWYEEGKIYPLDIFNDNIYLR
mgnify:CR=1 FL=1